MKDDTREMTKQEVCRHLGATLRGARLEAGLKSEEVALHVGMAPEVYQRVERGSMTPDLMSLRALCTVLELNMDVALGLASHEPSTGKDESGTASEDSPQLRRLMRTLRRLDEQQLTLLTLMARGYVKDPEGDPEPH